MAGNAEQAGGSLKRQSPDEVRVVRASDNVKPARKNVEMNNSTAVTNVIPFSFGEQRVRTLLITDQPWFVAADIAQALEYRIAGDMTRNLDEDEKGTQIVRTPGGDQEMLVINESGLYSAILRSRKAEAKRFKKWVTAEVLPAIRKHGRYEEPAGKMATLIGQTIGTDGFHMLGAIVKGKVSSLPQHAQRRATAKIWSQTHVAFGVRSAADIPAEQLDAARNFIAAYMVQEGEYIPRSDSFLPEKMGPHDRFMISTDWKGNRQITPIKTGAFVLTKEEFVREMFVDCGIMVSTEEMFSIAAAVTENLRRRSVHQAHAAKVKRAAA